MRGANGDLPLTRVRAWKKLFDSVERRLLCLLCARASSSPTFAGGDSDVLSLWALRSEPNSEIINQLVIEAKPVS